MSAASLYATDAFLRWVQNDEEGKRRWPRLYAALLEELTADSRVKKIEALMNDPAATPGERAACERALTRLGVG